MPTVSLGNVAPISKLTIPETGQKVVVPEKHLEQSTTEIQIPDHIDFNEALHLVCNAFWPAMSLQPPAWVASDDDDLEAAVARSLNCPRGKPDDWEIIGSGEDPPPGGPPMDAARIALDTGAGYLEPAPGSDPEPAQAPAVPAAEDEE